MTAVGVSGLRELAEAAARKCLYCGEARPVCDARRREAGYLCCRDCDHWTDAGLAEEFAAAFGPETALRLLGVAEAVERALVLLGVEPADGDGNLQACDADAAATVLRDVLAALR